MNYATVCSGIECPSVAFEKHKPPAGGIFDHWKPQWFSEINPFCTKLLRHHYPDVPNLGNMLKIDQTPIFNESIIDILIGGTPCQSFSTAGLREGLASANGNLALQFCRILAAKRPRWFIWENVPGVLSSFSDEKNYLPDECRTQSADFATLLSGFRECGYSVCWRVLDAQYFGVPQRRRRVFVVGYLGNDWRPPYAVLFEPESMPRNIKSSKKKRKNPAGAAGQRPNVEITAPGVEGALAFGGNNCSGPIEVMPALQAKKSGARLDFESEGFVLQPIAFQQSQSGTRISEVFPTLDANYGGRRKIGVLQPLIYPYCQITSLANGSNSRPGDPAPTLGRNESKPILLWNIRPMNSGKDYNASLSNTFQTVTTSWYPSCNNGGDVIQDLSFQMIRRITPLEAERLQGLPDNYTNIPGAADSPRYEAIGNGMAVPVMRWIGARIEMVNKIMTSIKLK